MVLYLCFENYILNKYRNVLRIKIHVNGTRGKSYTTRLIAAVLRSQFPTVAKTTGTLPRRILENGEEEPVVRMGSAIISEQIKTLIWAGKKDARAIVLECMALRPEYQVICEFKIIRADIAVITNIRADHLDVMGPSTEDVGWALAGMIPENGILITAEQSFLYLLEKACLERSAKLIAISSSDVLNICDENMKRFSHFEHKENVAIALKIAALYKIPQDKAWKAMWAAKPDPGALIAITVSNLNFDGSFIFVNALAANDPESTYSIWCESFQNSPKNTNVVALFNLREDRLDRTIQMAQLALKLKESKLILLMGNGSHHFLSYIRENCSHLLNNIIDLKDASGFEISQWMRKNLNSGSLVVAMGNIGGQGFSLVEELKCFSIDKYSNSLPTDSQKYRQNINSEDLV